MFPVVSGLPGEISCDGDVGSKFQVDRFWEHTVFTCYMFDFAGATITVGVSIDELVP